MKLFENMGDNQFWLTLWSMAFTLSMVIASMVVYTMAKTDTLIASMIDKGYGPIELSCLFNAGSVDASAPCLLIAQAKAKVLLGESNVPE